MSSMQTPTDEELVEIMNLRGCSLNDAHVIWQNIQQARLVSTAYDVGAVMGAVAASNGNGNAGTSSNLATVYSVEEPDDDDDEFNWLDEEDEEELEVEEEGDQPFRATRSLFGASGHSVGQGKSPRGRSGSVVGAQGGAGSDDDFQLALLPSSSPPGPSRIYPQRSPSSLQRIQQSMERLETSFGNTPEQQRRETPQRGISTHSALPDLPSTYLSPGSRSPTTIQQRHRSPSFSPLAPNPSPPRQSWRLAGNISPPRVSQVNRKRTITGSPGKSKPGLGQLSFSPSPASQLPAKKSSPFRLHSSKSLKKGTPKVLHPFSPGYKKKVTPSPASSLIKRGKSTTKKETKTYVNKNPFVHFAQDFSSKEQKQHGGKGLFLDRGDKAQLRCEGEFKSLGQIGKGEFGKVFKCVNRLDGMLYAIKKMGIYRKKGQNQSGLLMNEVFANAVLLHPNVVRYFNAWYEDDDIVIQTEYCNGGSLKTLIQRNRDNNRVMQEPDLKQMIRHVAEGLRYIHSKGLAHLDIKPGNILICLPVPEQIPVNKALPELEDTFVKLSPESKTNGPYSAQYCEINQLPIYKIGDFGQVTPSDIQPGDSFNPGDCGYQTLHIHNYPKTSQSRNYTKNDVFALGLCAYEAATSFVLPFNGQDEKTRWGEEGWTKIRHGQIMDGTDETALAHCSPELQELMKSMLNIDPEQRASAAWVASHHLLNPVAAKLALLQSKCSPLRLGSPAQHSPDSQQYVWQFSPQRGHYRLPYHGSPLRKTP